MDNSKRKNDVFYLVLLILTMITMVISITFTYFSLMASQKEDSTKVKTGTLSINYVDGKEFNTYDLIPTGEPNINTDYAVYKKKFSVSSDGTLDQYLDIYMQVTKNEFANNALKYKLYDSNNKKISNGYIPSSGKIILASNQYLKSGTKNDYTVLIWLQENNQNQDYEQKNVFVGSFDVNAVQVKYE